MTYLNQNTANHLRLSGGLPLLLSSLFITGCGGGGDSEPEAVEAPTVVVAPPVTPPITPPVTPPVTPPETEVEAPAPTSIDDLVVDPNNVMNASFTLAIQVASQSDSRGYLSVCDDYLQTPSGYKVNYQSCLLRSPLQQGQLSRTIKVANHNTQLIAVLWRYDGSQPHYQEWQFQAEQTEQTLLHQG